jgi:DNA-binding Lrp family transcriptional regulator
MSAGALARCLGATRRGVWKILRDLAEDGAIERCGAEPNHVGPARHLYRIAA